MELWLFGSIRIHRRHGRSVFVFGKDSVATISKRRHQNVRGDGMKTFIVYTNKYDGSDKYKYTVQAKDRAEAVAFTYDLQRMMNKPVRLVDFVMEVK